MILAIKPAKFDLYVNTKKKTAANVRKETGADIVINCWLYDMNTFKAVCDVKDDGKVLSDDKYTYWGYGFNHGDTRMTMSNDMSKWDNYFSVVAIIRESKKESLKYVGSSLLGCRPRSAIGFKPNGEMIVYCTKTNTSISQVQSDMLKLGCVDAINLDGGGSVQISSIYGDITSTRRVQGFLCIWIEHDEKECPYSEPIFTIKRGSKGNGAKWVQWMLNQHGNNLVVDGIFGSKSEAALLKFQKSVFTDKKDWDAKCGRKTREKLKA